MLALHRALRRMAGLVFVLVFWVLAGAFQRHGVGAGFYCEKQRARGLVPHHIAVKLHAAPAATGHGPMGVE